MRELENGLAGLGDTTVVREGLDFGGRRAGTGDVILYVLKTQQSQQRSANMLARGLVWEGAVAVDDRHRLGK